MNKKQKKILNFIKVLRCSFSDAAIIYCWGACYGFYEIIKNLYPECDWYMYDNQHILCKIWEDYYDIEWIVAIDNDVEIKLLTEEDHFKAWSWRDGQRVENMIRKYNNR